MANAVKIKQEIRHAFSQPETDPVDCPGLPVGAYAPCLSDFSRIGGGRTTDC